MKTFIVVALYLLTTKSVKGDITGGTFFRNRILKDDVLQTFEKVGPKMCIRRCMHYKDCKAINFWRSQLKCTLLSGNIVEEDIDRHLSVENDVDFTSIEGWKTKEDCCWPENPCSAQHLCVPSHSNQPVCRKYGCESGWKQFEGHCYYFNLTTEIWENAKNSCKSKGAYLVHIDNEEENKWLASNIANSLMWIGANDLDLEGRFTWVSDNSLVIFSKWSPGEPNNSGNEDCAIMDKNGPWTDVPCSWVLSYICEKLAN